MFGFLLVSFVCGIPVDVRLLLLLVSEPVKCVSHTLKLDCCWGWLMYACVTVKLIVYGVRLWWWWWSSKSLAAVSFFLFSGEGFSEMLSGFTCRW